MSRSRRLRSSGTTRRCKPWRRVHKDKAMQAWRRCSATRPPRLACSTSTGPGRASTHVTDTWSPSRSAGANSATALDRTFGSRSAETVRTSGTRRHNPRVPKLLRIVFALLLAAASSVAIDSPVSAPPPADSYPTFAGASAAAWPVSTTLRVTPDMAPGLYLLTGAGPDGVATGAPLVVRDDLGPHALTIVAPTLTWQAYNKWGNADLYAWPNDDGTAGNIAEADVITLNRPIMNIWVHAELLGQEKGLLQLINREGLDATWIASQDLQRPQPVLDQTRALVMSRHDEYWTAQMRATTASLINRGVNLLDLGGNSMYHAGKFLDASLRWYEVRKPNNKLHQDDPAYKMSYRFVDPPTSNPQARQLGENFNCISPWSPFKISDPKFWAWSAQKLRKGKTFPNIVGSESDGPSAGYAAGTVFASLSRIYCQNIGIYRLAGASYRVAGSRAGVVDIGTMNWLCQLTTASCGDYPRSTAAGQRFVTRATTTMLREAAKGPLGRAHPAVGGVKPPTKPSYARGIR